MKDKNSGFLTILLVVAIVMGFRYFFDKPEKTPTPVYIQESAGSASTSAPAESAANAVTIVENYQIGTAVYSGEMASGKPQGFGTMIYATGEKYEGVWDNGQMHGDGQFFWTNGDVYSGEFYFGARTGSATYYWASGDIYDGEFREGQLYGNGVMHYSDGSVFDGVWDHGTPCVGIFTDVDGNSYEAEWVNGSLQRKDS